MCARTVVWRRLRAANFRFTFHTVKQTHTHTCTHIVLPVAVVFVTTQVLQVHAEDGDKGNPREIRYGLVSEGNPFTSFFDINDTTGEFS